VQKDVSEKEAGAALHKNLLVAWDADDLASKEDNEVANKINLLTVPIHFDERALDVNHEVLQRFSGDGKLMQLACGQSGTRRNMTWTGLLARETLIESPAMAGPASQLYDCPHPPLSLAFPTSTSSSHSLVDSLTLQHPCTIQHTPLQWKSTRLTI
jgi:hypothetical protein